MTDKWIKAVEAMAEAGRVFKNEAEVFEVTGYAPDRRAFRTALLKFKVALSAYEKVAAKK